MFRPILLLLGCHRVVPLARPSSFFAGSLHLHLSSFPFHPHFLRPRPATSPLAPPPLQRPRRLLSVLHSPPTSFSSFSCLLCPFSAPFDDERFILLAGGDTPRFTEAYVPSSCIPPYRGQVSPWFFLVPSCAQPHNYRNDSVNSCALLPPPSSLFLSLSPFASLHPPRGKH